MAWIAILAGLEQSAPCSRSPRVRSSPQRLAARPASSSAFAAARCRGSGQAGATGRAGRARHDFDYPPSRGRLRRPLRLPRRPGTALHLRREARRSFAGCWPRRAPPGAPGRQGAPNLVISLIQILVIFAAGALLLAPRWSASRERNRWGALVGLRARSAPRMGLHRGAGHTRPDERGEPAILWCRRPWAGPSCRRSCCRRSERYRRLDATILAQPALQGLLLRAREVGGCAALGARWCLRRCSSVGDLAISV